MAPTPKRWKTMKSIKTSARSVRFLPEIGQTATCEIEFAYCFSCPKLNHFCPTPKF